MAFKKLVTATLLAATILGAMPAEAARKRAVRHPLPPSHIMQNVLADDDLRYTNHATTPNTITACIERTSTCITDVLNPGASITKTDFVRNLGIESANLELYTTGNAEIRGTNDAILTTLLTTERQNIPVMGAGQTFSVYTPSPQQAELKYLMSNGVERDTETITLNTGTNNLSTRPLAIGEQLDIIPTSNTIMTSTLNGVQYRAKKLTEAVGQQFIVKADNTTVGRAKNIDPTAMLRLDSAFYQENTDNQHTTYIQNFAGVNWGTVLLDKLTNGGTGSVLLQGGWENNTYIPFLAWSPNNVQTEANAATAQSGLGSTNTLYNTSLNQVPDQITLLQTGNLASVNGTLTGYNDAGTAVGTMDYTLPSWGNKTINVSSLKQQGATRLTNEPHNSTIQVGGYPQVLTSTTIEGIIKGGYRVEKPFAGTTGKEYVDTYLKPLEGRIFYLNNREFKCMINGNCGVRSYAPDLAAALYPTSNYPGTVQDFEQFFRKLTDGNNANGEAFYTKDPLKVSTQTIGKYHLVSLHPNDGAIKTDMNDATAAAVFNVYGTFLEKYTQTHPEEYGGSTATGPNKTLNPTWDNRDNNDPNTGLGM